MANWRGRSMRFLRFPIHDLKPVSSAKTASIRPLITRPPRTTEKPRSTPTGSRPAYRVRERLLQLLQLLVRNDVFVGGPGEIIDGHQRLLAEHGFDPRVPGDTPRGSSRRLTRHRPQQIKGDGIRIVQCAQERRRTDVLTEPNDVFVDLVEPVILHQRFVGLMPHAHPLFLRGFAPPLDSFRDSDSVMAIGSVVFAACTAAAACVELCAQRGRPAAARARPHYR